MNRREFLQSLTAGTIALSSPALFAQTGNTGNRPNIIFIMADDLGWKELGCYGQEKIKTPNIDRLATGGMKFTNHYAGSAVCAPSRCNLMTGMHGGHAYIRDNGEVPNTEKKFGGQTPIPETTPCIAKTLKKAGYTTGCFGKWGLGAQNTTGDPLRQGFDRFYGYNCQRNAHNLYPEYLEDDDKIQKLEGNNRGLTGKHYAPQLIADQVMEFVKKNKNKPFFMYYATVMPHLPLQALEEDIQQYKGKWPETPYKGGSYLHHETPRACYAAMISFMDRQIGRLMTLLKELALDKNTVVIFTSDNGTTYLKEQVDYEFFESVSPLRGLKGDLYEGGIRVPMVTYWPGHIKPGTVSDLPAAHYDIPATLANIAGTTFDKNTDGISILPTLLGKNSAQKKHDFLFWDFAGYNGQIAARMGDWKGIKRNVSKNANAPLELYNLKNDISEKNNVADKHPEIVKKIEAIMIEERTVPEIQNFKFGKYGNNA